MNTPRLVVSANVSSSQLIQVSLSMLEEYADLLLPLVVYAQARRQLAHQEVSHIEGEEGCGSHHPEQLPSLWVARKPAQLVFVQKSPGKGAEMEIFDEDV